MSYSLSSGYLCIFTSSRLLDTKDPPEEDSQRSLIDIFLPPLISLSSFYLISEESKWHPLDSINPSSESEGLQERVYNFSFYLPTKCQRSIEGRVQRIDSFYIYPTELVPSITIVRTSLLDEVECEGFIEIIDELLSMTEIVLQAPCVTHVFCF